MIKKEYQNAKLRSGPDFPKGEETSGAGHELELISHMTLMLTQLPHCEGLT